MKKGWLEAEVQLKVSMEKAIFSSLDGIEKAVEFYQKSARLG
jgi:TPR repeat protein